jgi:hypothetical protein
LPAFACLQVDFHSFEGILYTAPGIGWLMQNVVRRSISAVIIGGAQTAAAVWPPLEGWLRRALQGEADEWVDGVKARAIKLWWRQAPPATRRPVPPPYDPSL